MLANDSCTVACEVSVYLMAEEIAYYKSRGIFVTLPESPEPITGHIDVVQVRNGFAKILCGTNVFEISEFKKRPILHRVSGIGYLARHSSGEWSTLAGPSPAEEHIRRLSPTHNPTHGMRCLVRLTRCLAVPAVMYVIVKPNRVTLIRARSVVQVHPGPPFKSPVNTRRFSPFHFSGACFEKTICQKFAKSSSRLTLPSIRVVECGFRSFWTIRLGPPVQWSTIRAGHRS